MFFFFWCSKVRGHLPKPEIQSVLVQIQLDGVHHECTGHKSHSHALAHTRLGPIRTPDGGAHVKPHHLGTQG